MEVVIASNNVDKIIEFANKLAIYGIKVLSLKDLNIHVESVEDGKTFEDNAYIKANDVSKLTDKIVIADDSGIEIHALDNFPGVYSARFMEHNTYEEKFVEIYRLLDGKENKGANYYCALCVMNLEDKPLFFKGRIDGLICNPPVGNLGFGYDPIFYYPPFGKTLAQVSQERKNVVSHRGVAIDEFIEYLKEHKYI